MSPYIYIASIIVSLALLGAEGIRLVRVTQPFAARAKEASMRFQRLGREITESAGEMGEASAALQVKIDNLYASVRRIENDLELLNDLTKGVDAASLLKLGRRNV